MLKAPEKKQYWRLQSLRWVLALLILLFLVERIDIGLSTFSIFTGLVLGSIMAGRFLYRRFSVSAVLLQHALGFLGIWALLHFANILVLSNSGSNSSLDFIVPRLSDSLLLIAATYIVGFISSWAYWTKRSAVTVEALLVCLSFVGLLGAHRNYHVDTPRQISSLAWKLPLLQRLRVEPQHLFLGLGAIFVALLILYFFVSDRRTLFGSAKEVISKGSSSFFGRVLAPLAAIALVFGFAYVINQRYSQDLSRVSNGVGMSDENKEGQSNLGFHQAVSSTKQPAALLRLETDFENNPWEPMLYLREGALSAFASTELVRGPASLDRDVPASRVGEPFLSHISEPGELRNKVTQSIYLLSEHGAPFAIDFPRRISPIKNPYPEKFRATYQALSYAPNEALKDLVGLDVGEKTWSPETWAHYLRAPGSKNISELETLDDQQLAEILESESAVLDSFGEDKRYYALAREIVQDEQDPVVQAMMISNYLSEKSLYTRQPGHQVTEKGDPVAPYLFSDSMRGYCVHFAHAASYMLRLLGIPARIGTGYLTDLNYAKDGHILLQLGDRHAWPEFYVEGRGWMVSDITPAQAENEEPLVPDESLLDELMNKLSPVEELLDPVPEEVERPDQNPFIQQIVEFRFLSDLALIALVLLLLAKAWLRFGHKLTSDEKLKIKRAYISFASSMYDLGYSRASGETRAEYSRRLLQTCSVSSAEIRSFLEAITYQAESDTPSAQEINASLSVAYESRKKKFSVLKRFLAFLNPISLSKINVW